MTKKKEVKERILQTAFELFTTSSYHKVSIDDIVKKAGVSKGGLFHYFDSKYTLGREVFFWFAQEKMGDLFTKEYTEEISPKEHLKQFIDLAIENMVSDINLSRFFFDLFEEALNQDEDLNIWHD